MDFGSLDFATWRLVGLGLLALGAIAAVVAIVAIILMFRGGSTVVDRRPAEREWDDDDHDDHDDDRDDDHDEDDDADDEDDDGYHRDVRRDREGGPTALPIGPSGPQESLFTVAADAPPRPTLRSTRDEAHVPSPDWYDYADVDVPPAGDDHGDHDDRDHRDDDVHTALGATREAHPPATPTPTPTPPSPAPSTADEQSEPADRSERRRASRWFDETAADRASTEVSPSFLARYSDSQSAPPAGAPVIFPWERRAETTGSAPERRTTPEPEEPRRQTERRAERTETGATAAIPVTSPQRPDVPPPAAPDPAVRQEPQRPTEERQVEREDTGTIAAVSKATSVSPEARPAAPSLPVRQDPDAPEADWYDDPDGSGGERWWDGKSWTRHRRPRSGAPITTDTGRQRAIARQQAGTPSASAGRRRTAAETESDPAAGASSSRPPGWYRDPSGAGGRRFWDGSRWTTEP